jgi:hypothetical protein
MSALIAEARLIAPKTGSAPLNTTIDVTQPTQPPAHASTTAIEITATQ